MLIVSPIRRSARFVRASVSGMRHTSMIVPSFACVAPSSTRAIVSETPSRAIEPFSTTKRASDAGNRTRTRHSRSVSIATTSPSASTCPKTTCPPRNVIGVAACSRLTPEPTASLPRLVTRRVCGITSNAKRPPSIATTVRQHPLTEIDAPRSGWCAQPLASTMRRVDVALGRISAILPRD